MDSSELLNKWKEYNLNDGTGLLPSRNYIVHPEVEKFVRGLTISGNVLKDKNLYYDTVNNFVAWIEESTNNKITIADFERKHLVHNTYECLHEVSWRYRRRRLRILRGEQQYLSNSFFYLHFDELKPINEEHKPFYRYIDSPTGKFFDLDEEDWVYISIPFFGTGELNDKTEGLLNQADLLNVPVIIDCSLMPLSSGFEINLNRPCVKEVIFTLSNNIGMQKNKVGLRVSSYTDNDNAGADGSRGTAPIQLLNSSKERLVSNLELMLTSRLLETFSMDYLYNECKDIQKEICNDFDLLPTSCVNICMIPTTGLWASNEEMKQLQNEYVDNGNDLYPRVDISNLLNEKLKEQRSSIWKKIL